MSAAKEPERVQLGPQELEKMRRLSHDLSEVLRKISQVVLPTIGKTDHGYNTFAINLESKDVPLQIAIGDKNTMNEAVKANKPVALVKGVIYLDPPGVCIPTCW